MSVLESLLMASGVRPEQAWALALLILILASFIFFVRRTQRGKPVPLRPIAAYEALKHLLARAAEAGQPVHISLGTRGLNDASAADTLAGLTTLEFLADRAAVSGVPPIISVGDPTTLPLAQDYLRRAYVRQGDPTGYQSTRVRFIAPTVNDRALPYAAGVMDILAHEKLIANVMVGAFGDEYLLIGETGAQRGLEQVVGASRPEVLPFVYATAAQPLIGEEMYAAGAYLSNKPAHLGSLLAQDSVRLILTIILILAILVVTAGLLPR